MDLQYYARPTTTWADGHPLAPVGVNALGGHYFIETHRMMRESGFTAKVGRAMGRPFGIWRNCGLKRSSTSITSSGCGARSAP